MRRKGCKSKGGSPLGLPSPHLNRLSIGPLASLAPLAAQWLTVQILTRAVCVYCPLHAWYLRVWGGDLRGRTGNLPPPTTPIELRFVAYTRARDA